MLFNIFYNIMFLIVYSFVMCGIIWMILMIVLDIIVVEWYIIKVDRSFVICGRVIKDFMLCLIEEEWYC